MGLIVLFMTSLVLGLQFTGTFKDSIGCLCT
jgi:hypothetical protein